MFNGSSPNAGEIRDELFKILEYSIQGFPMQCPEYQCDHIRKNGIRQGKQILNYF